jgi:hypothetical protein
MAKRARLRRKAKLQAKKGEKLDAKAKAHRKGIKARHKAKVADAKRKRDEGDTSDESAADKGGSVQAAKRQKGKGGAVKGKPRPDKGKGKGKAVDNGNANSGSGSDGDSSSELSDLDSDFFNDLDAESDESDGEHDDSAMSEALRAIMDAVEELDGTIETHDRFLQGRQATDMWEALNTIPAGEEAAYHDEIRKRAELEDLLTDTAGEIVKVKAFVMKLPLEGFSWARVVVDEAQVIRNMDSSYTRTVRLCLAHAEAFHMATATPALNRISDVKSFGDLAAVVSKMDINLPNDIYWGYAADIYQPYGHFMMPKSVSSTEADEKAYRKRVEANRVLDDDTRIDKTIFGDPRYAHLDLRKYYEETGKRFWCLSSRAVSVVRLGRMEDAKMDVADSDAVYKAIMDCLLIKRSSQTPLATPDGVTHYPRDRMPGLIVRVEELGYADPTVAATVCATVTELLRSLYTIRAANDSAEILLNPAGTGEDGGDSDGAINMTILRALWMVSFHFASYRLMQQEDRTTLTRDEVLVEDIAQAMRMGKSTERKAFKDKAAAGGAPSLGAEHTNLLREQDVDGGLSYLFAMLCQDERVTIPSDRAGMGHFVMYESPILHRVVQHALKNKLDGERTLIVTNNPWMQQ